MPRAYLRMSPDLDQHPDPLAMVRAMCAAARQPERGRFRHQVTLERAVGKRQFRFMVERGDIVPAGSGVGVYLAGWDEWQEGDWTVAERMRRMRQRRKETKAKNVSRVTPVSSPRRNDVTTDAYTTDSSYSSAGDGDSDEIPPPPAERGLRKGGTNPRRLGEHPRASGVNPRATGQSPRQERQAEKRGPSRLGAIMAAALVARSEDQP